MTLTSSSSLPSIRPLSPVQGPDAEKSALSPHQALQRKADSLSSLRQQSILSATSRESFATAYESSPLATPAPSDEPFPSASTETGLEPPHSLRKSISVDSFVDYGRELAPKGSTRPNRVNTGTALAPPQGLVHHHTSSFPQEPDITVSSLTRARGLSVSTAAESVGDEYDSEREADTQPLASLSSHPGQLVLPTRMPALSNTSSMSSIGSAPSPISPRDDAHRLHSPTSLQTLGRRGTTSSLTVATGRARSGSLGLNLAPRERRNTYMTQATSYDKTPPLEVTLIVVGMSGCGKSTVIRKGLKPYRLSDTTTFSVPVKGSPSSLNYDRRVGRIPHTSKTRDDILQVIEVDSAALDSPPTSPVWPDSAPKIDGVVICYDASNPSSFTPVEELIQRFRAPGLPLMVLACKSDLTKAVDPQVATGVLHQYDVGLVEVTAGLEEGKAKMRRSFDWLLRSIFREPEHEGRGQYRNPASPDYLHNPLPWEVSRSAGATPTAMSSMASMKTVAEAQAAHDILSRGAPSPPLVATPRSPTSPSRARSTSDLLSEHERSRQMEKQLDQDPRTLTNLGKAATASTVSLHDQPSGVSGMMDSIGEDTEEKKDARKKDPRPSQWATLEELLDKLIFLAVSGDDPAYITHFLLTYRRFASPRSVLLAMTKRMRQLDNPSGDPMFACFAQMRICALLETWIRDYEWDFAVRGTAGALSALVKSIIGKTYLLHYGCDFLPFLEKLPSLIDKDASWAMKVEDVMEETDESYSPYDEDEDIVPGKPESIASTEGVQERHQSVPASARERKQSLPITAKSLVTQNHTPTIASGQSGDSQESSPKQLLKDLLKLSQDVQNTDSTEIAQEITRMEIQMFLDIEPRHWLAYTLAPGKKEADSDPISRFNSVSNHIGDWVVSLVLCHDKPRARARQVEKLVDIASKLRSLNNYSALRAFVAGINNATYAGDPTMEHFMNKAPDAWKVFQSWDLLLQHKGSHRAYRMALRSTKGACIPALEVHMSDLIRAHEGNPDTNPTDPTKIHWGKYNMIGRFIHGTTVCQAQARNASDYNFPERRHIRDLLLRECIMDREMQTSRITPPTDMADDYRPPMPTMPRTSSRDVTIGQGGRDPPMLRKILRW